MDIDKKHNMWYSGRVINSNWAGVPIGEGYLIRGSESGCYMV